MWKFNKQNVLKKKNTQTLYEICGHYGDVSLENVTERLIIKVKIVNLSLNCEVCSNRELSVE